MNLGTMVQMRNIFGQVLPCAELATDSETTISLAVRLVSGIGISTNNIDNKDTRKHVDMRTFQGGGR